MKKLLYYVVVVCMLCVAALADGDPCIKGCGAKTCCRP
jgi:hypothetical protein